MDNWNYGHAILGNLKTLNSMAEFEVDIQCEKCDVRFSVIGAAYFCPSCGYSSVLRNAYEAIQKTILTASRTDAIRTSLELSLSKTEAAILVKTILEQAVSACIGTLQAFSEIRYNMISAVPAPFNAFQNPDRADKLWMALKQQSYESWLTPSERQTLLLFTQRRHLLEHKGGIVDAKYLNATGDQDYKIGDKLVISEKDIIDLGTVIQKVIDSINQL
ncbi:hypothetical protein HYN43_008175 [Mucilaginibacter celer]|uniref:Uncharacterized protein n=2 Tax=Mucilaginibacter celer TaxID=2305508 RepID=A0A494VNG0_9SPHI|nr:hypothetical protein HYN43_008175 [Mucilaginibacter celer]